jgi:hypothetical protein
MSVCPSCSSCPSTVVTYVLDCPSCPICPPIVKTDISGYPPPPYQEQIQTLPPYNATNFTIANEPVYNTLLSYAKNSPNYPLPQDSNQDQIHRNRANITYFSNMNQKTQLVKTMNDTTPNKMPYPQFKSEGEKIMYKQGLAMTAARNQFSKQNPTSPAGVFCTTIYDIQAPTPPL